MRSTKGFPNLFVASCVAIIIAVGCGPAAHDLNRGAAPTGGGTGQDRLSELARTINDNPDLFHSDATPSVQGAVASFDGITRLLHRQSPHVPV
jgi:hypothetical protein